MFRPKSTLIALSLLAVVPSLSARTKDQGDQKARQAAQKGLAFLAEVTPAWQSRHDCYGCHVQAVTMQAMAVGMHHDYALSSKALDTVLAGLLTVRGGARSQHGLSHSGGREQADAKSYGGSALAMYDRYVGQRVTDDLVNTAKALLEHQREDGGVHPEVARFPVSPGPVHTTYRAVQTWRQAFARTADDAWLTPLRKGEKFLAAQARLLADNGADHSTSKSLQDLNFAALGLIESGAGRDESIVTRLRSRLLQLQRKDGGWGFGRQQHSNPYATGQTLYTLRVLGMSDSDRAVRKATDWLVRKQQKNGGWSRGGSGKAEAMWGVLGLVSLDVLSITVAGIEDGSHVGATEGTQQIGVEAVDNEGQAVKEIAIYVDDVLVHKAQGGSAVYQWDPSKEQHGLHLVDVVATNGRKQSSRRRLSVYTGDTFLTEVGSRFSDNGTLLTLRNIADGKVGGQIWLRIKQGEKVVWEAQQQAQPGAVSFFWDGRTNKGADVTGQRFDAELTLVDAKGRSRHKVGHTFVQDTLLAQRARFNDVQGALRSDNGQSLANTEVELVDGRGRVVRRVRSNEAGQYRFKNIDAGKYRVRVRKRGFDAFEATVDAEAADDAALDVQMMAH